MATYDIAIIGAGPAGYVAAIRAAQLGAKVCVIEKDYLGGVCLNKGCIPTKTLLKSTWLLSQIKESSRFGIDINNYRVNFSRMLSRKNEVIQRLNKGIELLFKSRKIELIKGKGRIISFHRIEVTNEEGERRTTHIEARNIIIATGSRPLELAMLKFDGKRLLSSSDILNIGELPRSLLIVGGGVIGCEFATLFKELGVEVTIIEMMEEILPNEDKEIAKRLESLFKRKGIKILTETKVESCEEEADELKVKLSNNQKVKVEKVLICVGRLPNTDTIGLEDLGVKVKKGYIEVDEYLKTNIPHIFAIGDCIGGYLLAHVASYEGKVVAENALGGKNKVDYLVVPNCIFTHPEIASVGLTEERAKKGGFNVKVGKFPFTALGKAQATGETEGLVKIVTDVINDKILGAQILGRGATELIAEFGLAIKLKAKGKDVAETIHAHPTMAEAIMEAAHTLYEGAIHLP